MHVSSSATARLLAPWESFMTHYSQLHPECVDWEATSAALDCLRASKRPREEMEQEEGKGAGEGLPGAKRPRLEDISEEQGQEGAALAKRRPPMVLFTGTQTASHKYHVAKQRHFTAICNTFNSF